MDATAGAVVVADVLVAGAARRTGFAPLVHPATITTSMASAAVTLPFTHASPGRTATPIHRAPTPNLLRPERSRFARFWAFGERRGGADRHERQFTGGWREGGSHAIKWEDLYLSHRTWYRGSMSDHRAGFATGYRLRFDAKRRPTLPSALLEEAGIDTSHEVVAHVEGPGRVVLEDPLVMLAAFQAEVVKGLEETGFTGDLSDELIAERATEALSD